MCASEQDNKRERERPCTMRKMMKDPKYILRSKRLPTHPTPTPTMANTEGESVCVCVRVRVREREREREREK